MEIECPAVVAIANIYVVPTPLGRHMIAGGSLSEGDVPRNVHEGMVRQIDTLPGSLIERIFLFEIVIKSRPFYAMSNDSLDWCHDNWSMLQSPGWMQEWCKACLHGHCLILSDSRVHPKKILRLLFRTARVPKVN